MKQEPLNSNLILLIQAVEKILHVLETALNSNLILLIQRCTFTW